MIEFQTPYEIINSLANTIEIKRKKLQLRHSDLAELSGVPARTYQQFIYKKQISVESLIKIMFALQMNLNLANLIAEDEIMTIEELRAKKAKKQLPKRIRVKKEDK